MTCSIFRNDKGEITKVLAPNQRESKLFKDLTEFLKDKEQALRAWAQVYTPSFKAWFGDWEKTTLEEEEAFTLQELDEPGPEFSTSYRILYEGKELGHVALHEVGNFTIKGIQFHPQFRGQGLGKRFYTWLNQRAARQGGILNSDFDNTSADARRVWESLLQAGLVEKSGLQYNFKVDENGEPLVKYVVDIPSTAYLQTVSTESSTASPTTLRKVNTFLERIGVDVRKVKSIVVNGKKIDANGVARALENLIDVVEGKENVALTEEAMHFAVELLEQEGSPLFAQMLSSIGQYEIYKEVFEQYRTVYKTADGKPDIRKIKKEAMGKLLAEHLIEQVEGRTDKPELLAKTQSWWNSVKEFLKRLFLRNGATNPFKEAVGQVLDGTLQGTVKSTETFYQLTDSKTQAVFDALKATHNRMSKNSNEKYEINGKEVAHRVSDNAKAYYNRIFPQDKKRADKEAYNDFVASQGTKVHADLEDIFHRYIDENGLRRDTPLAQVNVSQTHPKNNAFYAAAEKYFKEMLETYPPGTRFLSEIMVYDERKDQGGTMDFVAIIPNGDKDPRIDIKDWKTTAVGKDKDDLPYYKKEAYNIQISEYKDVLVRNYGVKRDQFRQTRAIPILTSFKQKSKEDKTLELSGLAFGNVDPKKITDLRLLPVATRDESTGNRELDKLLESLNKLHKILYNKPIEEGRRDLKNERLNQLERGIRTLQMQGKVDELLKSAVSVVKGTEATLTKAFELFRQGSLDEKTRKALLQEVFEASDILDFYAQMDASFETVELEEKTRADMEQLSLESQRVKRKLEKLVEVVGEELALGYGVKDVTDPEQKIGWGGKYFSAFSEARTKTTRVFRKIWNEVTGLVTLEAKDRFDQLEKMKTDLEALATKRGITVNQLLDVLKGKNKQGKWNGELIRKVKKEAYELFKHHQTEAATSDTPAESVKWLKDNIDLAAYTAWYNQALADKVAFEDGNTYHFNDAEADIAERASRVEKFKQTYDPARLSAFTPKNYKLRTFLLEDKWLSEEYQAIQGEPALLNFYNYWQERMKVAYDMGMIKDVAWSRFVPNVRKNVVERLYHGVTERSADRKLQTDWFASMSPDVENTSTTLTGEIRHNITAAYVHDLAEWRETADGQRYADYADKSDDLVKVLGLFDEEILKYQHRTRIEHDVRMLHLLEQNKAAYVTDRKTGEKHPVGNEENAKYFENFMNYYVYGVKYEDSSMDATYKLPINKYIRTANKLFKGIGVGEIVPYNEKDEVEISVRKQIEALNRFFQLKTLSMNVPTAISNYVGGKMNSYIQSGKEFPKEDLAAAEALMLSSKFSTEEGQKIAGLLELFFPFKEDEKRVKYRELSVQGAAANLSSEWLMYLQRKSDRGVRLPIQIAYLMNTMVVDGQLVNINEYVRQQNNYGGMYSLPVAERKALQAKIDKEVAELKKTQSLIKTVKIENDRPVLDGVDHKAMVPFITRVNSFAKDVLGNMDENDRYQYRMNIIFSSVMMFKNWIPRMVKVRYGGLTYNIDKDNWELGRWRLMWDGVFSNLLNAAGHASGVLGGEEPLIEKAKKAYGRYYAQAQDTGEAFMSEAEFVEMYLKASQEAIKEVLFFLALGGAITAAALAAPETGDDDDKEARSRYRFMQRVMDKAYDELAFFYSPTSLVQIANGSVFPALGMLSDIAKFARGATLETYYGIWGTQEDLDKNKVAKYAFKVFPITKELMTYVALFHYEFAKDYGIQIKSNYASR